MKDFPKPSNLLNIRLLFILVLCSFYACKKNSSAIDQNCGCTKSNTFRDNISTYVYNGEILGFGSLFTVSGTNKLYFTKGTDSFDYPLYELKNGVDSLLQDSCWYRPTISAQGWLAYTKNDNQQYIRKSNSNIELKITSGGINSIHDWSVDGKLVVKRIITSNSGKFSIYDTLGVLLNEFDITNHDLPTWHPNKELIGLLEFYENGTSNIISYDPYTNEKTILFENRATPHYLVWTKPNEFIGFERVQDNIHEVFVYDTNNKTKKNFFSNCHEMYLIAVTYNELNDKYYGIMNYTQTVDKVAYSSDSIVEIFNGKVIRTLYP